MPLIRCALISSANSSSLGNPPTIQLMGLTTRYAPVSDVDNTTIPSQYCEAMKPKPKQNTAASTYNDQVEYDAKIPLIMEFTSKAIIRPIPALEDLLHAPIRKTERLEMFVAKQAITLLRSTIIRRQKYTDICELSGRISSQDTMAPSPMKESPQAAMNIVGLSSLLPQNSSTRPIQKRTMPKMTVFWARTAQKRLISMMGQAYLLQPKTRMTTPSSQTSSTLNPSSWLQITVNSVLIISLVSLPISSDSSVKITPYSYSSVYSWQRKLLNLSLLEKRVQDWFQRSSRMLNEGEQLKVAGAAKERQKLNRYFVVPDQENSQSMQEIRRYMACAIKASGISLCLRARSGSGCPLVAQPGRYSKAPPAGHTQAYYLQSEYLSFINQLTIMYEKLEELVRSIKIERPTKTLQQPAECKSPTFVDLNHHQGQDSLVSEHLYNSNQYELTKEEKQSFERLKQMSYRYNQIKANESHPGKQNQRTANIEAPKRQQRQIKKSQLNKYILSRILNRQML